MPFTYVEDAVTSDVTFHAWGPTPDALFAAAIDATTAAMVIDLASVAARVEREVAVTAAALDLLLVRLLEEVIFLKDTERLLLRAARVHVETEDTPPRAAATLVGEPIDAARHALVTDVKAVTYYGLRVERRGAVWHAEVTLDV